jgi:hypothetical protein
LSQPARPRRFTSSPFAQVRQVLFRPRGDFRD